MKIKSKQSENFHSFSRRCLQHEDPVRSEEVAKICRGVARDTLKVDYYTESPPKWRKKVKDDVNGRNLNGEARINR